MGEAKVDGDYTGQPLDRPTRPVSEEDMWNVPGNLTGTEILDADATIALEGPDGKLYYRHFEGFRPIWDRPVPEELLPPAYRPA